jgi:hypothetical protein
LGHIRLQNVVKFLVFDGKRLRTVIYSFIDGFRGVNIERGVLVFLGLSGVI